MTSLTHYGHLIDQLGQQLTTQPQLALLLAISQFDPFYGWDGDEGWDDPVPLAIQILRQAFLPAYCDFLQVWRGGLRGEALADWLCQTLNTHLYAPLECLEQVIFGPPLQAWGLDWYALDDHSDPQRTVLQTLFALLAIEPDSSSATLQQACQMGEILVLSLAQHPHLSALSCAVQWALGISGNTLVDCTDEALMEMGYDPFAWSAEDLAFLTDLHHEAENFVAAAHDGLSLLAANPPLFTQLKLNIQHLKAHLPQGKAHVERLDYAAYTRWCEWPDHLTSTLGSPTPIGAEIL